MSKPAPCWVLTLLESLIIFLTPAQNIAHIVFITKTGTGNLSETV
jgi:hypothetical protein